MIPLLKTTVEKIPEKIRGRATTPEADHLFEVRLDGERVLLDKDRSNASHHAVGQLLFAITGARKYIKTTINFLATRVREPDEDDWGKLKCFLRYFCCTNYTSLILQVNILTIMKWWVGASYAMHQDCQSHTGATIYFGKGLVSIMSKRQKINTKILTKDKLVGSDNRLPKFLWTCYFLE